MTLVIGHRGASAYEPENTIPAFEAAVRMGADGIELDVHATADGTLVVYHDARLDGLPILRTPYHELKARNSSMPTLETALAAIGPDTIVYIELKSIDAAWDDILFSTIANAPSPDHCQVHAFDHRIVKRIIARRAGLRGGILSAAYPIDPVAPIVQAGAHALWQQGSLIDGELVSLVHGAGKEIIAWTVDDPAEMRQLKSLGVDGICSNKPDVARDVLK